MSETSKADGGDVQPEPVDAEFEPVDGQTSPPGRTSPARRTPWIMLIGFSLLAAAIGGGTGWLLGRYAPDPQAGGLEDRLAALEAQAALHDDDTPSALSALGARLNAAEDAINANQLRADGLEQIVRDVAALRGRVEALEQSSGAGEIATPTAPDSDLVAAVADIDARVQALADRVEAANAAADQAQSALQEALSTLAAAPSENASAAGVDSAALVRIQSRLTQLESALATLQTRAESFEQLRTDLQALDARVADDSAMDAIDTRIDQLAAQLNAQARDFDDASGDAATRGVALAALSQASSLEDSFAVEYADLRRVWPDAPGLDALTLIAVSGAPTSNQLTTRFPLDAVRAATGEAQTLFGVIRVERDGQLGPSLPIVRALEAGDLEAALAATQALDPAAQEAASDWLAQAQARVTISRSLAQMRAALERGLEAQR